MKIQGYNNSNLIKAPNEVDFSGVLEVNLHNSEMATWREKREIIFFKSQFDNLNVECFYPWILTIESWLAYLHFCIVKVYCDCSIVKQKLIQNIMFQVDIRSIVSGMQYCEKLKISLSMQKTQPIHIPPCLWESWIKDLISSIFNSKNWSSLFTMYEYSIFKGMKTGKCIDF